MLACISLGTALLLTASGGAMAADFSKAGSSEVYVNPSGNGGYSIDFTYQYVGDDCVSSGTPGDAFAFTDYLLVDNTDGPVAMTVDFGIEIYEVDLGITGGLLYSATQSLSVAAGDVASGAIGGASIEYTGWNGDPSCGGNFLVVRTVGAADGSLGSFSNSISY